MVLIRRYINGVGLVKWKSNCYKFTIMENRRKKNKKIVLMCFSLG